MIEYAILFVIGNDRPGIVDDVSSLLYKSGANIEDSRMTTLGGRFSIILLFSCSSEQMQSIRDSRATFHEMGLETSLHSADNPIRTHQRHELPLRIQVSAMDHPGIVQRVVSILRKCDVNIRSLNTNVTRAPLSGSPMFNLTLEAGVRSEKHISKIRIELDILAEERNLELKILNE